MMAYGADQGLEIQGTGQADWDTGLNNNFAILERGYHTTLQAGTDISTGYALWISSGGFAYPFNPNSAAIFPHALSYYGVTSGETFQALLAGIVRSLFVTVPGRDYYVSSVTPGVVTDVGSNRRIGIGVLNSGLHFGTIRDGTAGANGTNGTNGTGIGDMLGANNLTELTNITSAQAKLALTPGTNVQAFSALLMALLAITEAADVLPYYTSATSWAAATFTAAGRALVDDADATAQRATLGVVIGTNVQAFDQDLAGLASLVGTGYVVHVGSASFAERAMGGTAGRILLTNSNGAAAATVWDVGSNIIDVTATNTVIAGYVQPNVAFATKGSGTFSCQITSGHVQSYINSGAHTIAPPPQHGSMILDILNGTGAGALTRTGFTKITGDSIVTTNSVAWRHYITMSQYGSHIHTQVMS